MRFTTREFARFLVTGAGVGIAGIVILQGLLMIGGSQPWAQALAISLTYLAGALLSFYLQQAFVFRRRAANPLALFIVFLTVNIVISLAVGLLSGLMLSWPLLRSELGALAPFVAFGCACLAAAPLSYALTARLFASSARVES